MYSILWVLSSQQADANIFEPMFLYYFLIFHLISFIIMFFLQKELGDFAYRLPKVLLIPALLLFFATVFVHYAFSMMLFWIVLPALISSLVYIMGFSAYRKWSEKL